jgi:alanyl-tRNA synthetase
VRHGKLLGLDRPFLADAADTVIELMSGHYHELAARRDHVVEILSLEERKFSQTLNVGLQLLTDLLDQYQREGRHVVPGADAFRLYDTHGFPLELTEEVAAERGMTVDLEGFNAAMQRQQQQSKQLDAFAREREEEAWTALAATVNPTVFTGYTEAQGTSRIVALMTDAELQETIGSPQEGAIVLAETPFYAESGGQIGDRGLITTATGTFQVLDTRRPVPTLIVHYGRMIEGYLRTGTQAEAAIDIARRTDTRKNHSATHLLHRALKDLLGEQVQQAGSLVEPERLRFDFNFQRALTAAEIRAIDHLVNEWIRANFPVITDVMPYQEAIKTGAMALFSEKYGDHVRVVTMGTSKELCGGTHVAATGQIGVYVTTQETSIAAGIRRIEALTGRGAEEYLRRRSEAVATLASRLQTTPDALPDRVEQLLQELAAARKQLAQYQRESAHRIAAELASRPLTVADVPVVAARVEAPDDRALREQSDLIRSRLGPGVIVLGSALGDRASFVVSVHPELTGRGLHAGKIAAAVGERLHGKGGGRPDSAQGGGRDVSRLSEALRTVPEVVAAQLHQ